MQDRRKQGGRTGENPSPRGRKTPSEPAFPQYRKGMILPKGTAADGSEAQRNFAARSAAGVGRGEGFPLPTKSDCASRSDAQSSRGESAPFVKNAAVPQALSPGNAGRFRRRRGVRRAESPLRIPWRGARGWGVGRGPLPTKSDCASRSDAQSSRGESAPFVKNAAVPQALSPGNAGRFRRGDC